MPWFIQIPLVLDTPGQREPGYLNGNNPALSGIADVMGRIRYATNPNNRPAIDAISTTSSFNLIPGFTTPVLQNREVFDYRSRLISGATNRIEQNFTALNAAVTRELFNGRGGLELAVDKHTTRSNRVLPFSQGQNGSANGLSDISIDVSRYLSNDQPNPDLGRLYIPQLGIQDRNTRREGESFRATAFDQLDFDDRRKTLFGLPLGNHTFSGLYNTQAIAARAESFQSAWESSTRDLNTTVFQECIASVYRRSPGLVHYLGPSVINANSASDLPVTGVFTGRIPQGGDVQNVTFFDFVTKQLVTEKLPTSGTSAATRREAGRTGVGVGDFPSRGDLADNKTAGERKDGTCPPAPQRGEGLDVGRGAERWIRTSPKVRKLQRMLDRKAKAEPHWRFFSLDGELDRQDVLSAALDQVIENAGAPGVDGFTVEALAKNPTARAAWLHALAEELRTKTYRSSPLRRVDIWRDQAQTKRRTLGIPTVNDRVVIWPLRSGPGPRAAERPCCAALRRRSWRTSTSTISIRR